MFTQPSVNQIASAYQGNPQPLAQKVEADKKQHGGIPQDLRQLLALNDITQGRNAMGIQQALQIPTNMPTVAQSLQQQAQQAIQARLMDQAREQQRLQQKPPTLPLGTPQPRRQPQGIDALETNVGEEYAHGGIIGDVQHFDGKTTSMVVDPMLGTTQDMTPPSDDLTFLERIGVLNPENRRANEKLERELRIREQQGNKPSEVERGRLRDPRASQFNVPSIADQVAASKREEAPAPSGDGGGGKAPSIRAALDKAGIINLPIDDAARKRMQGIMALDPDAQERLAQEKFKNQVGEKDLSIYDKAAAELEARKQKLNAPKAGYEAMMDYLENIALSGGRTSAEAGARGASRQKQMQLSREAQQNELMDKILELGAKKSEAQYAAKEKLYQVGQERYKDVFKNAFDAAKDLLKSDDEARKLAQEAVLKQAELDNRLQTARIGAHDNLMSRAQALMKVTPGLGLEEAMKRASLAAGATQLEGTEVRALQAFNTAKAKLAEKYPEWSMPNTPKGREVRARYEQELAQARVDAGLPPMGINALPSAGGPTSSNIRSQANAIISGGR